MLAFHKLFLAHEIKGTSECSCDRFGILDFSDGCNAEQLVMTSIANCQLFIACCKGLTSE